MTDYTTIDAVKMAYNGDVSDFRNAVGSLLMDKIQDAVGMKKAEVAQSFMSPGTTEAE